MIKYSDLLLSLNVLLSFCFSLLKHNIILFLKYTCVEFISIKLPWKNQIKKVEKYLIILVFDNFTQLVTKALVAIRKKKKFLKMKPQHWHILIIWKRSNKIKAVKTGVTLKVLCHWQSQISELLCCFENIKLLNKFWVILSFMMAKKNGSSNK